MQYLRIMVGVLAVVALLVSCGQPILLTFTPPASDDCNLVRRLRDNAGYLFKVPGAKDGKTVNPYGSLFKAGVPVYGCLVLEALSGAKPAVVDAGGTSGADGGPPSVPAHFHHLVQVHPDGRVTSRQPPDDSDGYKLSFRVEPTDLDKTYLFKLFVVCPAKAADLEAHKSLCNRLARPGYRCLDPPNGDCWFHLEMLPGSSDPRLKVPNAGSMGGTCRVCSMEIYDSYDNDCDTHVDEGGYATPSPPYPCMLEVK